MCSSDGIMRFISYILNAFIHFGFFSIQKLLLALQTVEIAKKNTSMKPAKQLHIRGTNLDCLPKRTRSFSRSITNMMTTCSKRTEILAFNAPLAF